MSQAVLLNQLAQLENPDSKVLLNKQPDFPLLSTVAHSYKGISTYDDARFLRKFWESSSISSGWERIQYTSEAGQTFGGCEGVVLFEGGQGQLRKHLASQSRDRGDDRKGRPAWHKWGVAVSQMGELHTCIYTGEIFQNGIAVLSPLDKKNLAPIWCFCSSHTFREAVRVVDQKVSVTNSTISKVPFDLEHWQKVADEKYPDGLPEPHSDDPTQWLFQGDIPSSTNPLHVGMARLLGYEWPDQLDDGLSKHIDADGIVTLTPVVNQEGVANRLRSLLQAAYESPAPARAKGAPEVTEPRAWDESTLPKLLAQAGFAGMNLDEWLRDKFFESHCKLFHQRPFIWHIWDGRKDGFHAFVNYHKFDSRNLERLTHVYLGEWIERQRNAAEAGDATAEGRLAAAQALQKKLEMIRIGEKPFDIFVRWKSLAEQPIGWEPDLNDGVRMNIRPFVEAGILRGKVNVKWTKDRGKDPKPNVSGTVERHNDLHFSLAEKRAAREEN